MIKKINFELIYKSVTAPKLDVLTIFEYFESIPLLYFGVGFTQSFFLFSNSSSDKLTSISCFTASTVIKSPSYIRAIFPPTAASGAM